MRKRVRRFLTSTDPSRGLLTTDNWMGNRTEYGRIKRDYVIVSSGKLFDHRDGRGRVNHHAVCDGIGEN